MSSSRTARTRMLKLARPLASVKGSWMASRGREARLTTVSTFCKKLQRHKEFLLGASYSRAADVFGRGEPGVGAKEITSNARHGSQLSKIDGRLPVVWAIFAANHLTNPRV